MKRCAGAVAVATAAMAAPVALGQGNMVITEWMYAGDSSVGGEFVELTNIGDEPVDMAGWSFDDDNRLPGSFDLSAFGIVQPGQSVIFTEDPAENFRADWGLGAGIVILGDLGNDDGNNLGRNDEINIYDAKGQLIDRLAYGDENFPGSIRTRWFSGNPASTKALGANDPYQWVLAGTLDVFGSWTSANGDVGNPGIFTYDGPPPIELPLYINEVMASNSTTLEDDDGDYSDWIELYNAGERSIDLTGFGLSDDTSAPFKWVFPAVSIGPGQFLLVFASNKDRTDPSQVLHTNFAISAEGEEVLLTHSSGVLMDEMEPTPMAADVSYGRQPDGTGPWFYFSTPTPGMSNVTSGHLLTAPVEVSHTAGLYDSSFDLTLTCDDGDAVIYYTLDGSTPTERSPVYTRPITIASRAGDPNYFSHIQTSPEEAWALPMGEVFKVTTVRAMAVRPGAEPSAVQSNTYLVDEAIHGRYSMPIVSIMTDEENFWGYMPGIYVPGYIYDTWADPNLPWWHRAANYRRSGIGWERPAHIEFFEVEGAGHDRVLAQDVGVRIHGGATRAERRKSLRIYARSEYGESHLEYPFFFDEGHDRYKRIVLRNSGNDSGNTPGNCRATMFRDGFMQNLVKGSGLDVLLYRPTILFINGEYWGIHNMRERYDRHYLGVEHNVDPDNLDLLAGNAAVIEGDAAHYNAMLAFITTNGVADPANYEYVKTQMDVENYITYWAAQIYFRNTDWPANNIDFWRPRTPEGRWQWLLYDTDFGFGLNGTNTAYLHNSLQRVAVDMDHWSTVLFQSLLESAEFRRDFINRFADMMNTYFLPQNVLDLIDEMASEYEPEMPEQIHRWNQCFDMPLWLDNVHSRLAAFGIHRPLHVRNHIASHFELPGTVELTFRNFTPERGHVRVNTVDLAAYGYPWSGEYFADVPLPLQAVPEEGYYFIGWEGIAESEGEEYFLYTPGSAATLTARFGPGPQPGDLPGDLNGDGVVGVADMLIMLAAWGACPAGQPCPADLDDNGSVGVSDLILLFTHWSF